ncbi:MAG: c-type cytochrome domain-containing protein, partial [Chitinophagaceae bacterium]
MKFLISKKILLVIGLLVAAIISYLVLAPSKKVDFSADVKPILNKKCITCHGGVKAKSGFSVLFREDALANTESGKPAIIP